GLRREGRYFLERCSELRGIREGQICSADGSSEQAVANERDSVAVNDHVPRSMSGRVDHSHLRVPNLEPLAIREFLIGSWRLFEWKSVHLRLPRRGFVEAAVERMQIDGHIPFPFNGCDGADVIDVGVGDPDRIEGRARALYRIDESLTLAPRIDYNRAVGAIIHDQIAILLERSDGDGLDVHRCFAAANAASVDAPIMYILPR